MSRTFPIFVAAALGIAAANPAAAQSPVPGLYHRTLRSTVFVIAADDKGSVWSGSGWVADRDERLLVTNHHVTSSLDRVKVVFPRNREGKYHTDGSYQPGKLIADRSYYLNEAATLAIPAEVVESDPARDLAVIRVNRLPAGTDALALAASSPSPGERLHSIGNPGVSAACWVYTDGAVRAVVRRQVNYSDGQEVDTTVIETTSPVNHGDSGGPVVNDRGQLVGVTSGGMSAKSGAKLMSWMIDVTVVRDYLAEVNRRAHATTAGEFHDRGNHHFWAGRYDRAILDFSEALRLDPTLADAHYGRARSFSRKGDHDTSIPDLDAAIRIRPHAPYHAARGLENTYRRKYNTAVNDFTEAIRLDPKLEWAYAGRGHCYSEKKAYRKALADYGRAAKLAPRYAPYRRYRGSSYLELKSYEKALEEYQEAVRLDPNDPYNFGGRAIALARLKRYRAAIRDFTRAIALNPGEPVFYEGRATIYQLKGDKSRAQADFDRARELKR